MRRVSAVVVVVAAVWASGCATRVGVGYGGIKVSYAGSSRGVEDVPRVTGWVFYSPLFSQVIEYPTFVQTAQWSKSTLEGKSFDESITFNSKENMVIGADISLSYQLEDAKIPHFYVKFRSDNLDTFTHGFLRNVARDAFNEVGPLYSVDDIMGPKKAEFLARVRDMVNTQVGPYGVRIEQFGFLGALHLPPGINESITAKIRATQDAIRIENELRQTQAAANKTVAEAEGYARSLAIHADADASYNEKVARSLTPLLVQKMGILQWDGKLPQMTGGVIPFLNVQPK